MKSLAEIMRANSESESLAVATKKGMGIASVAVLGSVLGKSKATQFADDAADLITSDDFLNELESELGLPQKGESEDEFVARAKASMFEMLKAKLK
ncbi:hypothetical protein X970_11110 [Pseudomonas monteilii SB3101]|uniref:Uncharacterized protein n=2 Tax=Pseudomonas monteilii TaxID=76759 RepID=A0A7X3F1I4_9PSED|nr:hypothetical protein [Pseudomonas monteilii]AHC82530.1 hypothetical protein X969_11455 [Pseudomonas monteilii SB3078]AHC87909.1 hypothetical protein X970_11110 [Pseudomonas monteilii SB3101]MVF49397.1 hypothetical protein [Pseudomonas monteilii]